MNLCRWWMHRTAALLPLIVLSSSAADDYMHSTYRRCVAAKPNHTFLELEELRSVPCVECANISSSAPLSIAPNKDRLSVGLFVKAQDDQYYPQAIAASLLNHSHQVTMLTSPDMPHTEKEITERILRYVPCEQQAEARFLLTVRTVPMARYKPDCPDYGVIMCHVPDRAWVHALYVAVQSIDHGLDVMLLEATSIGALLVTENFKIPSIAMTNDASQLREVLGSTYRHRKVSWTPLGWRRWIEDMFRNRWHTLAGTKEFMSLNILRRRLRMLPIRKVTDVWKRPQSVIMTTLHPSSSGGQDSNLQTFTSPILPPCLPCWSIDKEEMKINEAPVIMVTTNGQPTSLSDAKYILKGLSMALASLREFRDDCDWEEEEPVHCWNGETDFSVIWLPTEGATPVIMPDFVKVENGSLLDSLARYNNTLAIVTQCVDDSLWINGLGPKVLCWDESSSPRDMGLQLLQLLKKPLVKPAQLTRGDCLRRIVSLVERVANVKRKHGSEWKTAADMGRDLKAGLHLLEESIPENNGGVFVFAAWCILISAIFYVVHEKTFPKHTSRLRRYRHHQRPSFTDIMDEIVFRLPELEQTWGIWSDWSKEHLSDMGDSVTCAPRERADPSKDVNHSTHSVRKRRPAKKRH